MKRPIRNEDRSRASWLVPIGLLLLGIVPGIGGALRLAELGHGAPITAENARFFAAPEPVALHIVSAVLFSVLGAFQFFPGLRRRRPLWHRYTGRLAAPLGLAAALSGLWMTLFYPNADANFDGPAVYVMRLAAGFGMAAAMVLALAAIAQRDIPVHQRWMTRAYALGMGAGTQVFTHIPWSVWPEVQGELLRAVCMGTGWIINIVVAEWIIKRQ
ncbi:MAG: DUF2306 domain-containing protein [Comamonadaceae bacterium]|jgi:uncharacterized membrane protein|nr:DUF2306 domain-containing protein [Comamonadaceae bacterium]